METELGVRVSWKTVADSRNGVCKGDLGMCEPTATVSISSEKRDGHQRWRPLCLPGLALLEEQRSESFKLSQAVL